VVDRVAGRLIERGEVSEAAEARLRHAEASRKTRGARAELWLQRGSRYAACRLNNYQAGTTHQKHVKAALVDFAQNISAEIDAGTNLLLTGPPGTGKDHLLAALAREAITQGATLKWTSGVKLFARLRDDIEAHAMERETVREFVKPHVLWISDPIWDGQPLTRQQRLKLGEIVDERYNFCRAIWISINAKNSHDAIECMGGALVDRLRHGALSLACDWPSFRQPRSQGRNGGKSR